jgi:hypothetical protein
VTKRGKKDSAKRAEPGKSTKTDAKGARQEKGPSISRLRIGLAIAFPALIFFILYIGGKSDTIGTRGEDARLWTYQNVTSVQPYPDYTLITCEQSCLVVTPDLLSHGISADQYPYVTVRFRKNAEGAEGLAIHFPHPVRQNLLLLRPAVRSTDSLMVDLRDRRLWRGIPPHEGLVSRVGLAFVGSLELEEISFSSRVRPMDYARLLWANLVDPEPVRAYSINGPIGIWFWGHQASVWVVMLLLTGYFFLAILSRKRLFSKCLAATALAVVLLSIPSLLTLGGALDSALRHSGFTYDQTAEYASRYDEAFASFTSVLHQKVPAGSSLYFPRIAFPHIDMEANIAEFLESIRYKISDLTQTDYIAAYGLPEALDPALQSFTDRKSGVKIPVSVLYRKGPHAVMKVVR